MSQTTRCPSCGTLFKVVADQLRISDGWVRCGQCQQVFDAASHLLEQTKKPLLPELALDQLRPPLAPVRRTEPAPRLWGEKAPEPAKAEPPAPPPLPAVGRKAPETFAETTPEPLPEPAPGPIPGPIPGPWDLAPEPVGDVLQIPEPQVPAFLALPSLQKPAPAPSTPVDGGAFAAAQKMPDIAAAPIPAAAAPDMEWPRIELPRENLPPTSPPEAEQHPPSLEGSPPADPRGPDVVATEKRLARPATPAPDELTLQPKEGYGRVLQSPQSAPSPSLPVSSGEALELAEAASVQAPPARAPVPERTAATAAPRQNASASEDAALLQEQELGAEEPSFLRAARRKAFWRRPLVRGVLLLLALVSLAALGLQVAVQERNYLAARYPTLRAELQKLCGYAACALEPYRNIAAVEVDSSSFQKLRGDEYRLALTLKNRSPLAVAMPAIELTLTDAMDQAVLRRVFLPQQWAAPTELAAQGEWSITRSLQLDVAASRITGYRVVAFYP